MKESKAGLCFFSCLSRDSEPDVCTKNTTIHGERKASERKSHGQPNLQANSLHNHCLTKPLGDNVGRPMGIQRASGTKRKEQLKKYMKKDKKRKVKKRKSIKRKKQKASVGS